MVSDLRAATRDHFRVAIPAARFHKQTGGRSEVLLSAGSAAASRRCLLSLQIASFTVTAHGPLGAAGLGEWHADGLSRTGRQLTLA